MREIRTLRAMWRALETGSSLKTYAPALDPTEVAVSGSTMPIVEMPTRRTVG